MGESLRVWKFGRCSYKEVDRRILLGELKQCPGLHLFEGIGFEEEMGAKF